MITVYSTPSCTRCQMIKKLLTEKNIPFEVSEDIEFLREKGFSHVPVVDFDGILYDDVLKIVQKIQGK